MCVCRACSTGGKGVKVDIGNISDMEAGSNTGGIGAGNSCNVMGEKLADFSCTELTDQTSHTEKGQSVFCKIRWMLQI